MMVSGQEGDVGSWMMLLCGGKMLNRCSIKGFALIYGIFSEKNHKERKSVGILSFKCGIYRTSLKFVENSFNYVVRYYIFDNTQFFYIFSKG